jgi:HD-GYP domain-containing protein (c-di-GMP phosphodiesterase class II)
MLEILEESCMQRRITVNLGNLVLSLSDAMELVSPLLIQHQQRTAYVVSEMGKHADLTNEKLEKVFIAALLHDIGAISLEEKIALRNYEAENVEEHCARGDILLRKVPWLEEAARIIGFHHREWRHWNESIETPLVFESQLLVIADYLERQIERGRYILHQHEDIISRIESLSGSFFHPQVVELFRTVSEREEFWLDLVSPRLYSILLHEGPVKKIAIGFSELLLVSELFRNMIDFRSRFTATHSSGVSACASMLSRIFGLTETEIGLIEVAGNLHDLGKLAIPNSILEKPGKLTKAEMAVMKSHTYYTYYVIDSIGGIQQIAEWAAYHHEKLDGSGYPFHCTAAELGIGARIMMVADIFTALAEDRPYRKGMTRNEIMRILDQFSVRGLLDAKIISLLSDNYEEIFSHVAGKQAIAREFYENQFSGIH